ncbi:cupin domain-containing protein [Aestuariivirga sp.]|uniref:cupin domain-containing protein n=1 Tax=Aestuariivirga sp. TaxID=2650926 RepID=UPI0039E428EC
MSKVPSTAVAMTGEPRRGSRYPAHHNAPCIGRAKYVLGDQFGLDQFGVNLAVIEPGSWSSQRHWHEKEDEFVYVLEGELVLVDDAGEHLLTPGMCAGFKAGNGNGHCLQNRTDKKAVYLEVGSRKEGERAHYSDIDMMAVPEGGKYKFVRKDGSPV